MSEKEIFESKMESTDQRVESNAESERNQELWSNPEESREPGCETDDAQQVEAESEKTMDAAASRKEEFLESFKDEFKGDEIREGFDEAIDQTFSPDDLTDPIQGMAGITGTLGEAMGNTGRALQEFGPGLGEMMEAKADGEVEEMFVSIVGEVAETAIEATGSLAGPIVENFGDMAHAGGESIEHSLEAIDDLANGDLGSAYSNLQQANQFAEEAANRAKGIGTGALAGAGDAVYELGEGVFEVARETVEGVGEIAGIWDDEKKRK